MNGDKNTVFRAEQLSKIYRMGEVEVHALRSLNLEIYQGEFVVLLEALIVEYERKLADHRTFILREGLDPQEINDWRWQALRQGS